MNMSLTDLTNIPSPSIGAYVITFIILLLAIPILLIVGFISNGGGGMPSSDKGAAILAGALLLFILGGSVFGTIGYHEISKESKKLTNMEQSLQEDYGLTFSPNQKTSEGKIWSFDNMLSGEERMAKNKEGETVILKIVKELDGDTLTPYVNGKAASQ